MLMNINNHTRAQVSITSLRDMENNCPVDEEALKNYSRISQDVSLLNCIDLSDPDIQNSVYLLKQACLDSGFLYVVNHGISEEFMDEVFRQSKRFFDLPLSDKMKLLRKNNRRGYSPFLDQQLDPGDFKEGYYIGTELPDDDPDAQRPCYGSNVWPNSDILPGWRETMEKYCQQVLGVAKEISKIIALALNLGSDFFLKQEIIGKNNATLKLNHYEGKNSSSCKSPPGRISDPENGIYGAGAHTDFSFITLLATDSVHGLQDKDATPRRWEFVAPLKGAFIMNIGDLLERWSNCIFRSTLHRVICSGQDRYSIAYFVEPYPDCLVECLFTCQSPENPPKFPPIKSEAHMRQRYKDSDVK